MRKARRGRTWGGAGRWRCARTSSEFRGPAPPALVLRAGPRGPWWRLHCLYPELNSARGAPTRPSGTVAVAGALSARSAFKSLFPELGRERHSWTSKSPVLGRASGQPRAARPRGSDRDWSAPALRADSKCPALTPPCLWDSGDR